MGNLLISRDLLNRVYPSRRYPKDYCFFVQASSLIYHVCVSYMFVEWVVYIWMIFILGILLVIDVNCLFLGIFCIKVQAELGLGIWLYQGNFGILNNCFSSFFTPILMKPYRLCLQKIKIKFDISSTCLTLWIYLCLLEIEIFPTSCY